MMKTAHLHKLCNINIKYRALWDRQAAAGIGVEEKREPTNASKIAEAAKAMSKWIAAGRPTRTTNELAVVNTICDGCEHKQGSKCGFCGCYLAPKTRMATEHCPLEKW